MGFYLSYVLELKVRTTEFESRILLLMYRIDSYWDSLGEWKHAHLLRQKILVICELMNIFGLFFAVTFSPENAFSCDRKKAKIIPILLLKEYLLVVHVKQGAAEQEWLNPINVF